MRRWLVASLCMSGAKQLALNNEQRKDESEVLGENMPQTSTVKLDMGERFPTMSVGLTDGRTLTLPDDLTSDYTIFLGYRGKW